MDINFIGSEKQIKWARDIYNTFIVRYGRDNIPSIPYATFWINHRTDSLDALKHATSQREKPSKAPDNYAKSQGLAVKPLVSRKQHAINKLQFLAKNAIVCLDTETTGLYEYDEILEITVTTITGDVLFHSRVKPKKASIHKKAYETHGISLEDVSNCPSFSDVWVEIHPLIKDALYLTYNESFDTRLIKQSLEACGIPFPSMSSDCLMKLSTAYFEVPSLKLVKACEKCAIDSSIYGKAHGSIADTLATSALLRALFTLENIPFTGVCPSCKNVTLLTQKGVNETNMYCTSCSNIDENGVIHEYMHIEVICLPCGKSTPKEQMVHHSEGYMCETCADCWDRGTGNRLSEHM